MAFKSGFISLIGRPNVGKSSLLNKLLGTKVSIVTNKAQTTQHNVRGVLTVPNQYQLIFIDTPGVHTSHLGSNLNRQMNASSFKSIKDADFTVFLAPANEKIGKNDLYLLNDLQKKSVPFMLVLSKKDLISEDQLSLKIEEWKRLLDSKTAITGVSISDENSVSRLVKKLLKLLPANDYQYFDEKLLTDQPLKITIQDLIREAILFKTGHEVPHDTLVIVESIENRNKILKVHAVIIVEHDSQKGILIGSSGKKIKDIKYRARKSIKELFPEHKIELTLFVKVKKNWKNSLNLLKKEKNDKGSF